MYRVTKLLVAAWLTIAPAAATVAEPAPPVENIAPAPNPAIGERSDGRLDPPPKRRWRLLPEVLLSPLRGLVWVVAQPVGAALREEDRKHPMRRLVDLLTWSHGQRALRPAFYNSTIYIPEFGLRLRPQPWLGLFATFATGIKRFDNGDRVGGDPGVAFVYDPTTIAGFVHGTTFVRAGTGFVLDLRDGSARASSGVLVQASFDYTHGIDGDVSSYERLRALALVPINLWAHTHVLRLQAATAVTWQNQELVPFSELPTLGGPDDLRGFRFQDFRDYTSFYATAEYRWPLWMWVDGALFVDYGGVFGRGYAGFGARRMQPDVGVGMHVVTRGNFHFRAQLGYGFGEGVNFSLSGTGL
ncbi:MAG: outer membrane protein assembly complex, YaeT protein [bacterium]|nr:outer membrane protein assembly complex, YaeT protein [bacterium]